MKLKELLSKIEYTSKDDLSAIDIKGVVSNSKNVKKGDLFVAVKGENFDGHNFVTEAIKKGAAAVLSQAPVNFKGIANILVKDSREALAALSSMIFDEPSKKIRLVGVTGTNGKTTISFLINEILELAGIKSGLIGTVEYRLGDRIIPSDFTTPDAWQINQILDAMLKNSLRYCVMEVSSHSLDQKRVDALMFDCAIFTNLSHDHLDYHKNFDDYSLAKLKLFEKLPAEAVAIVNSDESFAEKIKKNTSAKVLSYSIAEKSEITVSEYDWDINGIRAKVSTPKGTFDIISPLKGLFNLYNILAAVAFGINKDIDREVIKEAIARFSGAPGRLEKIDCARDFNLFIDYAHTPDALIKVLATLKKVTEGKLILVFGCGGNRDRLKRPKMGKVGTLYADYSIITSDNPRQEEPADIIEDILLGIEQRKDNFKVVLDRADAIKQAIAMACPGDTVLIAGKGHEKYQIVKDKKLSFDDREIARRLTGVNH